MDAMGIVVCISLLLFAVVIFLVFMAIFSSKRQSRLDKLDEQWKEMAKQLGWMFDPKKKGISGTHQGKQFLLDPFEPSRSLLGLIFLIFGFQAGYVDQTSRELSGRVRLRMEIVNPVDAYMSLVGKISRTSIENLMFRQTTTSIEEIDHFFSIESKPKDFARKVFESDQIINHLLRMYQQSQISLAIRENELNFQVTGVDVNEKFLLMMVNVACDVANAVERISV